MQKPGTALEDVASLNAEADWVSWTARTFSTVTIDGETHDSEYWRAEILRDGLKVYVA
jgi:hypothetical protein